MPPFSTDRVGNARGGLDCLQTLHQEKQRPPPAITLTLTYGLAQTPEEPQPLTCSDPSQDE